MITLYWLQELITDLQIRATPLSRQMFDPMSASDRIRLCLRKNDTIPSLPNDPPASYNTGKLYEPNLE